MLPEIRDLYNRLEDKRKSLIKSLHFLQDKQPWFQTAADRWSILMVLQLDTHLRQINSIPAPPDSNHGEV